MQAYQHQDVPFEQLVEYLNINRALNRNPIFQVLFVLQNATQGNSLTLHKLRVNPLETPYTSSKFDLSISAYEYEEGIELMFEYSTDLFFEKTVARVANHFILLIKNVLENL